MRSWLPTQTSMPLGTVSLLNASYHLATLLIAYFNSSPALKPSGSGSWYENPCESIISPIKIT